MKKDYSYLKLFLVLSAVALLFKFLPSPGDLSPEPAPPSPALTVTPDMIRSSYSFADMVDLYRPSDSDLAGYMSDAGLKANFQLRFEDAAIGSRLSALNLTDRDIFSYLKARYTSSEVLTQYNAAVASTSGRSALAQYMDLY